MNKLSALMLVAFIVVIGTMGLRFYQEETSTSTLIPTPFSANNATIINTITKPNNFIASFEIYTNGTKRIFTQAMYHNQSPDVYIENPDPSIVHVKKSDITWDDFFKTLPFSLTKDCLVTGTKQTFCSTETKKLRFLLNGVENSSTLETSIKPNDRLRVTYGD